MTSFAGIHDLGNAQPSHPLTTIRRSGVITDVSGIPNTVTVLVGGDTTTPVDLPYLHSYTPAVGDTVILLAVGPDYLVCGSVNSSPGPVHLVTRVTTLGMAINDPTPVVVYTGVEYKGNGSITFLNGLFTVTETGLFRWDGTVNPPAGTGRFLIYAYKNGVLTLYGRNDGNLASTGGRLLSAGGPIPMTAGDTLQLVVQSPDLALTLNPFISFSLERIG